ncbi:MAG: Altronate dehydratase [Candidatus Dichloromethanomonas elyunquensis]|nr:MAG: Altronate dehydratase [Candidatus Dichloromethanomonas elyunquensis]
MQKQAVVINPKDNVATTVADLAAGTTVSFFVGQAVEKLTLSEIIPLGHKFALCDIRKGQEIIKYGESIGSALAPIAKGSHVHIHNIQSNRGRGDL